MGASTGASGNRWAILILVFTTRIALGFQFQTMGSVADPVGETLAFSHAETGTLVGLYLMPGFMLAIPAGLLGRWMADRWLLGAGLLLVGIGGLVAASADGFAGLAAGRLLSGAGFVLSGLYFTKVTADWFGGRELATAMAVMLMSWPFGIAMGQVGYGWLALYQGWRAPFLVASVYALLSALAVVALYRPPAPDLAAAAPASARLTGREWTLTLIVAVSWAAFNSAYVIYLSFAPKVLIGAGMSALAAASVVSVASWVMIFSGALCGQLADRFGRAGLILTVCLAGGMVSFALLPQAEWAIATSLAYGLIGVAPAGLIVALTAEAMAPHKRAFGMGVYQSLFSILTASAPAVAGWLFDRTGDPYVAILFAIALMAVTLVAYYSFRLVQRRPGGVTIDPPSRRPEV